MFSNELDFEQSEKLVELIYKMAQIDSQYDFDEESFVEQLKFEFDVEKIPDTGSVNDLIDYFSSKSENSVCSSKRFTTPSLCTLCSIRVPRVVWFMSITRVRYRLST